MTIKSKNSILEVAKAKNKVQEAFQSHFKNSFSQFEVGIDPANGDYTIVVFVKTQRHKQALPAEVDGYKIYAAITNQTTK